VDKFFLSPAREQVRVEEALERGRSEARAERLGAKSIVVLPFAHLSGDPQQTYFADGMAEEMLNLLARIPELRVISRTSAFAFKGKDVGIAQIAEQLKVSHVLEGSVRRSGDRIRITAQLIEAGTDSHLWSETYDRALDDVFAIQDEIAGHVVAALKLELFGTTPRSKRVDPQAYLMFMQARQLLDSGQPEYVRVHALLTGALDIEPDYADAWTGLAWLHARCYMADPEEEFCRDSSRYENRRLSTDALDRALSADPENATALAYRAWALAFDQGDWAAAGPHFERAMRLDPTRTDVLRPAIIYARNLRRPELAIRLGEFAIARDPLCELCVYQLARAYRDAGELDSAEQTMRNFAAATGRGGWHTIATILLSKGQPQAALEALSNFKDAPDPEALQVRAMALHSLGRTDESRAALAQLEADGLEWRGRLLAEAYAWLGDTERAFDWLEREANRAAAVEFPTVRSLFDWTSPFLRPLLDTARGQAILQRFNASDAQFAAIRFDVDLPD